MIGQFLPRPVVREALGRAGYACQQCGRTANHRKVNASWMGLEIHHENGLCFDHRPENLAVLCSPCHHRHHGEEARKLAVEAQERPEKGGL
jgi:5-methylcytosine-specific restriction endonuclease McrA